MNYSDGGFSGIFFDFRSHKLTSAKPLWIHSDFNFEKNDLSEVERLSAFGEKFSYMIPGGECFENLSFDLSDMKVQQAERYGGNGIGDNAGGVRCGNLHGYQIKGIGKNPLAGSSKDQLHSYGGLSAVDAIQEAIYATVIEKLAPAGVVRIHGVILTGPDAAYNLGIPQERGWGALMIRDLGLRPAHFFRTQGHVPSPEVAKHMLSDVGRVRMVNKQLRKQFASVNDFVQFLGHFLKQCADQFGPVRNSVCGARIS